MKFLALVFMLLVVPACEPGAGAASSSDAPVRTGEVDLVLGVLDGPSELVFGRISGVARDSAGRLFVADGQAANIRVFAREGDFTFTIGRRGSGPGEFLDPCCLTFDAAGHLWVRDNGNARYQEVLVQGDGARATSTLRFSHGDANRWAPVTFDQEGRLVDIGYRAGTSGNASLGRMHLDSAGSVAEITEIPQPSAEDIGQYSVTRSTSFGRVKSYVYQPFGPAHLVAHGPGGQWADALSSEYSIRWRLPDGTERVLEQAGEVGPELTLEERDRAAEAIERDIERLELSRAELPYRIPDRKPPLRGLTFDRLGRLWVERSTTGNATERRADVYSPDGTLVERRAWPAHVSLNAFSWIEDDVALGSSRDSLGVGRVVRLRFSDLN